MEFAAEFLATSHHQSRIGDYGINTNLIQKWGFKRPNHLIVNCRSESFTTAPFLNINKNRCIVIAQGYYEWKNKQPYYISDKESKLLYMAGIWQKTDNGPEYVIITREAVTPLKEIHHRMPVLLTKNQRDSWIYTTDPSGILSCKQYDIAERCGYFPVTSRMSSVKYDDPSCIIEIKITTIDSYFVSSKLEQSIDEESGPRLATPLKRKLDDVSVSLSSRKKVAKDRQSKISSYFKKQ